MSYQRDVYIYDNGYGTTSDIYNLPVGTKFRVVNGNWVGKLIEEDGVKYISLGPGKRIEVEENVDYRLAIEEIAPTPEEAAAEYLRFLRRAVDDNRGNIEFEHELRGARTMLDKLDIILPEGDR
jgi:hypothetical protein